MGKLIRALYKIIPFAHFRKLLLYLSAFCIPSAYFLCLLNCESIIISIMVQYHYLLSYLYPFISLSLSLSHCIFLFFSISVFSNSLYVNFEYWPFYWPLPPIIPGISVILLSLDSNSNIMPSPSRFPMDYIIPLLHFTVCVLRVFCRFLLQHLHLIFFLQPSVYSDFLYFSSSVFIGS